MSPNDVASLGLRLLIAVFPSLALWYTWPAGSAPSTAGLLSALAFLIAFLLLLRMRQPITAAPEARPSIASELASEFDRQVTWWRNHLAFLREQYDQSIPDPETVRAQLSRFEPNEDPNTVLVLVLRCPLAAEEIALYRHLLVGVFGSCGTERVFSDLQRSAFRRGSEPSQGGYFWELQRIKMNANPGKSTHDVITAVTDPLPGAGVMVVRLLFPDRHFGVAGADMPGYVVQDDERLWQHVPYLMHAEAPEDLPFLASAYCRLAANDHGVPVFV